MPHPLATWHCQQNMTTPPPPPSAGDHRRRLFHPAFYWGKDAQILFRGWPGTSAGMYAVALLLVFGLAVVVELISCLAKAVKPGSSRFVYCLFQAGMHAVRTGFAYFVVLALTSFNGGVFVAAVLGHAVGYSVFRSGICFTRDD